LDGYILDTCIIEYWYNEHSEFPAVKAAVEAHQGEEAPLYISVASLGEIQYGHAANPKGAGVERDCFIAFVRDKLPQALALTRHTVEPYGLIRAQLFELYAPRNKRTKGMRPEELIDPIDSRELGIQENDLWMAAQAIERNLVLVTHDGMAHIRQATKDLDPPLRIEDWTQADI